MKKRALMIIAFDNFRDEEYLEPKKVLVAGNIEVVTASNQLGQAKGKLGLNARVDLTIDEVKVSDYDAIIFVGGPGSYDYFDNPLAQHIAQKAVKQDKILGAICAAVGTLAKAGVLKGLKATSFPGVSQILTENGAHYLATGLEIDALPTSKTGKIITADGPTNAKKFGEEILKKLLS